MMMHGGFMMVFGWLAVLVIIIFGAKILLDTRWGSKTKGRSDQDNMAVTILKERYAQGELSESEYLNMKANLLK